LVGTLKSKRGSSGDRGRLVWLLAGIAFIVVVVSGSLIAYNMLSSKCNVRDVEGFSDIIVGFDERSSLLPNLSLVALGPERARYEVYVFYDLYCPFCAWEFYESLPILLSYANSGKVKLYMVDTILHGEARESHGLLRGSVDFKGTFIKALYISSCRLHVEGKVPDPSYMRGVLSRLNITIPEDRVRVEVAKAQQITRAALNLLTSLYGDPRYVGTPTIVVYDVEFREVKAILPGRVEPGRIDLTLKSLP
jgi:hypothetical protein